jgi:hypothetical protein
MIFQYFCKWLVYMHVLEVITLSGFFFPKNAVLHKGRDWLPVYRLSRPAGCSILLIGCLKWRLGLARLMQKLPLKLAHPIRENRVFV